MALLGKGVTGDDAAEWLVLVKVESTISHARPNLVVHKTQITKLLYEEHHHNIDVIKK